MQVLTTLGVAALLLAGWAWLCPRLAARSTGHEPRSARAVRLTVRLPRLCLRRSGRLLPEGHRPPPGLGPLSPSKRFLTQEAARGLRELQLYLLDSRAA